MKLLLKSSRNVLRVSTDSELCQFLSNLWIASYVSYYCSPGSSINRVCRPERAAVSPENMR